MCRKSSLVPTPLSPYTAGMTYQETIGLKTSGHRDVHDIAVRVAEIVANAGVRTGTAHVFNVGSDRARGVIT
jgi:thiamine phosphate synthase YjbQ (UPF0047 family)